MEQGCMPWTSQKAAASERPPAGNNDDLVIANRGYGTIDIPRNVCFGTK